MSQNKYLVQLEKPERSKKRIFGLILVPADDIIGDFVPQDIVAELIGAGKPFGRMLKPIAQFLTIDRPILVADNSFF